MKRIIITTTLLVAALSIVGGVSPRIAGATRPSDPDPKITICHSTGSFTNPYTRPTISASAIVDTGTPNTRNKHDHHNGPIFDGTTKGWGDIIPPFDYGDGQHYDGKNWDTKGQAIYDNDCQVPGVPPVESQPDITAAALCTDVKTGIVTVTLTNSGDAAGEATVNGMAYTVAANSKETVTLSDTGAGASVVATFYNEEILNQTIICHVGNGNAGGETPSDNTPVTPSGTAATTPAAQTTAASLPYTGANTGLFAIVTTVSAAVAAGASYFVRRMAAKQF